MEDKYHEAEEERINVQVAMEMELEKKQNNLEQAQKELEKLQKDIIKVCSVKMMFEINGCAKTKAQISFTVTVVIVALQIVLFLKFPASNHLLCLYSLVCVGPD